VTTDRHRDFAEWEARDQQPHLALSSSSTLTRDVRSNSSGGQTVTVMQAAKSWHGYDSATHIRVHLWFTIRGCSLVQCKMRSIFVVQVGYKTPIKLVFEKSSTAGTHGVDSAYWFGAKRVEVAVLFCAACERI
jgi:hypothetical protein